METQTEERCAFCNSTVPANPIREERTDRKFCNLDCAYKDNGQPPKEGGSNFRHLAFIARDVSKADKLLEDLRHALYQLQGTTGSQLADEAIVAVRTSLFQAAVDMDVLAYRIRTAQAGQ